MGPLGCVHLCSLAYRALEGSWSASGQKGLCVIGEGRRLLPALPGFMLLFTGE